MTACPYCGRGNDAGAKFCMDCGKPLGQSTAGKATATAPDRPSGGAIVLALLDDAGNPVERFERRGPEVDVDATTCMGSLIPSADIASLTQLRADGSARDVIQVSPGRDTQIGRERGEWIFPYDPSMSAGHVTIRSEDADIELAAAS